MLVDPEATRVADGRATEMKRAFRPLEEEAEVLSTEVETTGEARRAGREAATVLALRQKAGFWERQRSG